MAHRIIYTGRRYLSGLTDVLLNLWNPSGTQVVTNGAMTEIGTTGIYYYDYTPTVTGTFTGHMDSASQPSKETVSFEITTFAGSTATGTKYCSTLQVLEFIDLVQEIPAFVEGSSSSRETVGTGNGSTTEFYLDHKNVIASTYTLSYGSSFTTLTETTHYTIDKDAGKITLTTSGVTAIGNNSIYAIYKYSVIPDSVVDDFADRASRLIDNITNSSFTTNTATDEYHDGKGEYEITYFTEYAPIISVTSLSTTQNDDETAASSTTWTSLTENDHFFVDTSTGRIAVTYASYRPVMGHNRMKVTYSWGYSTVPAAIEEETVRLAAQKLLESSVAGSIINAKANLDTQKLQFTIDDIRRNLKKYCFIPFRYT